MDLTQRSGKRQALASEPTPEKRREAITERTVRDALEEEKLPRY